jgi:hypothetical protein
VPLTDQQAVVPRAIYDHFRARDVADLHHDRPAHSPLIRHTHGGLRQTITMVQLHGEYLTIKPGQPLTSLGEENSRAVLIHPAQQEMANTVAQLIAWLRACETPEEFVIPRGGGRCAPCPVSASPGLRGRGRSERSLPGRSPARSWPVSCGRAAQWPFRVVAAVAVGDAAGLPMDGCP